MGAQHGGVGREDVDALPGRRPTNGSVERRLDLADAIDVLKGNIRVAQPDRQVGRALAGADDALHPFVCGSLAVFIINDVLSAYINIAIQQATGQMGGGLPAGGGLGK